MIRVLFTGVGRRVELIQTFREAGLVLNKELKIYGADSSTTAPALAYCDVCCQICGMKEERYIDELLSICGKHHIDLLIPTIDTDLLTLAENRKQFEDVGTKVLISSYEMVNICQDKRLTSKFFSDCGLITPSTVDDWNAYKDGFPAFIKPKDGSSSINAYRVDDIKELELYASKIKDYIVQSYISGTEYTVDIFTDFNGQPIYIIPRVRMAVRSGEVLKTEIDLDEKIIDECKRIVAKFKPCGAMTVQLIRDKEGADYFIEINPRFGGGAPLAMKAGAKSAEALLKLVDGENIEQADMIADGAVYSRFDQSVWIIRSKKRIPVKGVIFDLDDTLYSEKEYVHSGYKAVAQYLGFEDLENEMWNYFRAGRMAINACLERIGKRELSAECIKIYREHKPDIRLYHGVRELIGMLKEDGIKIGIITDGRPYGQRRKISALGLDKMVADIIITDELGGIQFRKPCDIAFRIMARKWRLPYENIVYIGDNPAKDFQAPRQLGMQSVWFKNSEGIYNKEMESSICYVERIEDLKGVFISR